MKVFEVLHMNDGEGEASYAQNSLLQRTAINLTKPIKEEAIATMFKLLPKTRCLAIAELGCSAGPNTLLAIGDIITAIYKLEQEEPISIEVFLNDLPQNDFNTVFRALPGFEEELKQKIGERFDHCFFHGVPGSFYGRLFQPQSLHLVHASYSLHFLSQVPKQLGRCNKGNIYSSSESPKSVTKAYYEQFQTDFSTFLSCRSKELVKGGCVVFALLGKGDDPSIKGSGYYMLEPLAFALRQLVKEGIIEEEMLDTFNIPMYMPSPMEIETAVNKEGSFKLKGLQVSKLDWEAASVELPTTKHVGLAKVVRAVVEPMLLDHFGHDLMEPVFTRFELALADYMANEKFIFTNVAVSLVKTI